MAIIFWSGVGVSVQSALSTSVAITGISKANPAVVTHSGADPSVGDYVLIKSNGMNKVNDRVFRVASVVASTSFALEGVDSSAYETFASGTFEVITFGTTLSTISSVSPSGGEPNFTPTTTIHDTIEKQVPTTTSPLSFGMTSHFDPSDAALAALKVASDNIETRAVKFTFSSGAVLVFVGYVSFPFIPTGQAQGVVESPLTFTANGQPTVYAS